MTRSVRRVLSVGPDVVHFCTWDGERPHHAHAINHLALGAVVSVGDDVPQESLGKYVAHHWYRRVGNECLMAHGDGTICDHKAAGSVTEAAGQEETTEAATPGIDGKAVPVKPSTANLPRPLEKTVVTDLVEVFRAVCTGEGLEEVFAKWLRRIPVDPRQKRPTPAELVRRVGKTVIFETPGRARYVVVLFFAAHQSKTWGEFRSLIPEGEWERLVEESDGIPEPDEPFDATVIPGFSSGNWPPTTAKEKKAVVMAFLNALPSAP